MCGAAQTLDLSTESASLQESAQSIQGSVVGLVLMSKGLSREDLCKNERTSENELKGEVGSVIKVLN